MPGSDRADDSGEARSVDDPSSLEGAEPREDRHAAGRNPEERIHAGGPGDEAGTGRGGRPERPGTDEEHDPAQDREAAAELGHEHGEVAAPIAASGHADE